MAPSGGKALMPGNATMRVLVLGSRGRLGQMLRWGWQRIGAPLTPIWQGRDPATAPADWLGFDILQDPAALAGAIGGAQVVLNLAGVTPPAAERDLALNTDLALAVAGAANRAGIAHLVASSAAVYGRAGGLCRESDPLTPAAPYGIEKHRMEQAVLALGGRITCLRIGNVAGADQILGQITPDLGPLHIDQFPNGRTPARSYIGPLSLSRILADLLLAAGRGAALPPILNLALPGTVEMGALLDAAPHPWQARRAPDTAIGEVALDITALSRFTRLDPEAGRAPAITQEWRAYRAAKGT